MAITAKYKKKIQVNMSDPMWEEVKRLSDEQGVSNSEILRQALEAGLPVLQGRTVEDTPTRR